MNLNCDSKDYQCKCIIPNHLNSFEVSEMRVIILVLVTLIWTFIYLVHLQ